MSIASLEIKGLRGFAEEQTLRFAQPSNKVGSGLTILVGPNNGGKSTIVESLQAISSKNVSFSEGKRNRVADERVTIRVKSDNGDMLELRTFDAGGSSTIHDPGETLECFVLPSRRYFNPYFGSSRHGTTYTRQMYLGDRNPPNSRSSPIDDFPQGRLFDALDNLEEFNKVLSKVMDPVPIWTIDQSDQGQYYLKLNSAGQYHNSDGLGEGIVSLLFIIDSLYDSQQDDLIVIDEPELSLHPAYQRRLARLFAKYAKDRQIVVATHSPYFVDTECILNGAEVARIHKEGNSSLISQLSRPVADRLEGLLKDSHNPHVLGLNAREAFFLEDGVIVLEGQDDVVHYPKALDQLEAKGLLRGKCTSFLGERFFGWGAGGAHKIERILAVLHDLGFKRVAAVFDKDKRGLILKLEANFQNYFFGSIPADDVLTKKGTCTPGLFDHEYKIRPEFETEAAELFGDIDGYLRS